MDLAAIRFDDDRARSLQRTCYHRWMLLPVSLSQEDPPYDETLIPCWIWRSQTFFEELARQRRSDE